MRINPASSIQQAEQLNRLRDGAAPASGSPVPSAAPVARVDRVEISEAGRALSAQGAGDVEGEMSPERVAELRQRVLSGAYNSLHVVEQVARRMLQRGDV